MKEKSQSQINRKVVHIVVCPYFDSNECLYCSVQGKCKRWKEQSKNLEKK